jgi:hypothetical protein
MRGPNQRPQLRSLSHRQKKFTFYFKNCVKENVMSDLTRGQIREILGWGAIGGILPTLSKIAGTFGANFDAPVPNLYGVGIAVALYGFIGAVVARGIGNAEVKQAIFAGIAAPAILVSVIAGVSDSKSLHTNQTPNQLQGQAPRAVKSSSINLFSSAYAQTAPTLPGAMGVQPAAPTLKEKEKSKDTTLPAKVRTLDLQVNSDSNYPVQGYVAVYSVTNGKSTPVSTLSVDTNAFARKYTIQVPTDTTALRFVTKSGAETTVPTNKFNNIGLSIYAKPTTSNDFLWALGGTRTLGIGDLTAKTLPGSYEKLK